MKYILITYSRKPSGQIDEQVQFSKRIKPSDLQTCNVIMNYETRRVEKCTIEGKRLSTGFDQLHEYYKEIYPNHIRDLMRVNNWETAEEKAAETATTEITEVENDDTK